MSYLLRYSIWYPGLFCMFCYFIFLSTTWDGIACMWLHCHYYVLSMNVCLSFIPVDTTTHLSLFAHILRCKSYFIFTYHLPYWLYLSLPLSYLGIVSISVCLLTSWGLTSIILGHFHLPPSSFTHCPQGNQMDGLPFTINKFEMAEIFVDANKGIDPMLVK